MAWFGPINTGAAVGADGSATANADSTVPVCGMVKAVYVRYNDSPPAGTTDVTLKTKGTHAPSYNILVLTNAATDGLFFPTLITQDTTGASRTYDATRVIPAHIPVDDFVNVAIAQANAADNVDVWIYLECG